MSIEMAISSERQYSIARARDNLPGIVHEVEKGRPIELTRRGKPVAVIVSIDDYERMTPKRLDFVAAVEEFRRRVDLDASGVTGAEWDGVRDTSPGREVNW